MIINLLSILKLIVNISDDDGYNEKVEKGGLIQTSTPYPSLCTLQPITSRNLTFNYKMKIINNNKKET
eukprot:UN10704